MKAEDFGIASSNNIDSLKRYVVEIHFKSSTRFVIVPVCSFELVPFLDILLRDGSDNFEIVVRHNGD